MLKCCIAQMLSVFLCIPCFPALGAAWSTRGERAKKVNGQRAAYGGQGQWGCLFGKWKLGETGTAKDS